MNSERFETLVLQTAEEGLEREKFEFLAQCVSHNIEQLSSQQVGEFLLSLENTEQYKNIYNLLSIYYIKVIITTKHKSFYEYAVNSIKTLNEAGIDMGLIEKKLVQAIINSSPFDSEESLYNSYKFINSLDLENLSVNLHRFFGNMHTYVLSMSDKDFDIIQFTKMIKRLNVPFEYSQRVLNSLQSLLLSLLARLHKEKNLNLFLISLKAYIDASFPLKKDIQAKYKSLISSKFLLIAEKFMQNHQDVEEFCQIGQRVIQENLFFYSAQNNQEGYFQLINEIVQIENIFELAGRSRVTNISLMKNPGKINMKLEIPISAQPLSEIFMEARKYSVYTFCLIFCGISDFLRKFLSFPVDFCFNTHCILVENDGTAFLLPDHSFCSTKKEFQGELFQTNPVLASYKLALLMQESIAFLDENDLGYEQLVKDIETIKNSPDLPLEQIADHLRSKTYS